MASNIQHFTPFAIVPFQAPLAPLVYSDFYAKTDSQTEEVEYIGINPWHTFSIIPCLGSITASFLFCVGIIHIVGHLFAANFSPYPQGHLWHVKKGLFETMHRGLECIPILGTIFSIVKIVYISSHPLLIVRKYQTGAFGNPILYTPPSKIFLKKFTIERLAHLYQQLRLKMPEEKFAALNKKLKSTMSEEKFAALNKKLKSTMSQPEKNGHIKNYPQKSVLKLESVRTRLETIEELDTDPENWDTDPDDLSLEGLQKKLDDLNTEGNDSDTNADNLQEESNDLNIALHDPRKEEQTLNKIFSLHTGLFIKNLESFKEICSNDPLMQGLYNNVVDFQENSDPACSFSPKIQCFFTDRKMWQEYLSYLTYYLLFNASSKTLLISAEKIKG